MADDAAPAGSPSPTPAESSPTTTVDAPAPGAESEGWPVETLLYQFFYILDREDIQACCVGAESTQGAIDPKTVQLVCLECGRIRTCPSHRAEQVI